jgi:NAD(P)H-dependent FMN reductase
MEIAAKRGDAEFTLIYVAEFKLPVLDEALLNQVEHQHTKDWAATIARYDAFVFVTAEYNRSLPGGLKNAIDYVFYEWHDQAAGFVSYGGARAAEYLRLVLGELKMVTTREQVLINTHTDFENWSVFKPTEQHATTLHRVFDEVIAWGTALKPLRDK